MKKMPNILRIMADQLRFDALGCYGSSVVPTPNIDRLAKEGVLFNNCYVNNPVCTPSRCSMFTGKSITGHGVYRLHDILPESEVCFSKRLKERGYKTALFGKLHISGRVYEDDHRHPNDGFDIYKESKSPYISLDGNLNAYTKWLKENHPDFFTELNEKGRNIGNFPKEAHLTRWVANNTIDFLKSHNKDIPFFCDMSIFDPHDPYNDVPEEMLDLIDINEIPDSILNEGESENKPLGIQREHEHSYLGSFHDYSPKDIKRMRLGYYASIAFIDREVGRVLETLEKEGLKENTIVVFVSDHGDMLGDHELLAKGAFFYDQCTKVPFIIRYPEKISKGIKVNELVQPHDLAATLLAQADFNKETLQKIMPESQNLIELVNDKKIEKARDYAVCLYRGTSICDKKLYWDPAINATMFRDKRYKLNLYHDPPEDDKGVDGELYDMIKDPYEHENLWDRPQYGEIKMKMLGRLINWMVTNDIKYNASRGGDAFPNKSKWSQNNPL